MYIDVIFKTSAYPFKHFRKELALQQEFFKVWHAAHAAAFMITSIRSFKHGTFFFFWRGGGGGGGRQYSTVITNSSGLCMQRSGLEEAHLIKVEYLKWIRAQSEQHSRPFIQSTCKRSNYQLAMNVLLISTWQADLTGRGCQTGWSQAGPRPDFRQPCI